MVVTSKIATGNQIDFETLSLNRRHLSIVGPSLLLDCLSHSVICPSNSCVCTESVAHGRCLAALLKLNYTPRPWLWILEAVKSLFSFLSSLFPLPRFDH